MGLGGEGDKSAAGKRFDSKSLKIYWIARCS